MKIALVHDYLYTYGGAERVLEALCEIWPKASIFTAWVDWQWLKNLFTESTIPPKTKVFRRAGASRVKQIRTSWFDKVPFKKQLCSPLRFLAPKIWSSFDFSEYDVVISSSAWYMSKGVSLGKLKTKNKKLNTHIKDAKINKTQKTINNQQLAINNYPLHICYCHTPPRYLYGYPTATNYKKYWWGRMYANIVNPFMRYYDFKSSQTVDYFICNSKEVQRRIWKFYRRKAKVIYPPSLRRSLQSEGELHQASARQSPPEVLKTGSYFLMVNRLVKPKNVDLGIKVCKKLKVNLKIAGTGPEEERLKKLAGNSSFIEFLGYVDDEELNQLYRNCKAVLYLAEEEDFGITPVEAMSFGKPVIALRSGGIVESVIEGKTGWFIDQLSVNSLIGSLKGLRFKKFKKEDCQRQAKKFSKERFKREIKKFVEEKLGDVM